MPAGGVGGNPFGAIAGKIVTLASVVGLNVYDTAVEGNRRSPGSTGVAAELGVRRRA
jgi:hypothetical protein